MGIKIDIISGFFGAGKTTLIKKLIDQKFKEEKIAIIENEFGEVSIDTDILKELNLNIKEIKSGCICEIINFDKDIRIYEENEIIVNEKYEYNNLINVKHSYDITKKLFDLEKEKKKFKSYNVIRKNKLRNETSIKNHSSDSMFSSWAFETKEEFSKSKLKKLFEEIIKDKDYGFILRGKGIVKLDTGKSIQFHYVPGQFAIIDISEQETGKICIIGSHINKNKLNYLFEGACK